MVCVSSWVRFSVGPCAFSSPVTFDGQCGPCFGCEQQRDSRRFRADSGTNLIKQGEIVIGRPYGPVAQWSEYSHGMQEVLGSSPGRAMCFFLPCDTRTYIFCL